MTLSGPPRIRLLAIYAATTRDHPGIADFLATTGGIGGRKFAADSRDVAEQLDGAFPDGR